MLSLDHLSQIITQLLAINQLCCQGWRRRSGMRTWWLRLMLICKMIPTRFPKWLSNIKMAVRSSTGCAVIARLTLDSSATLLRASINWWIRWVWPWFPTVLIFGWWAIGQCMLYWSTWNAICSYAVWFHNWAFRRGRYTTVSGWSSLMLSLWFIGGAQRSQLSTQYHARPTYLKPGQIVSQQIKLNGEGQYLSVQIHQDSSLKVSLHDQQNGQTWYLKRRGDSYRLSRSLKAGNYQIRVANQTSQKQPIAILKTDHYQMAGTSLISPITKKRRINIGCWSDVFGYDIIFWSKNIGSASLQRKWCQWRSWNNEGDTSQHYERDSKCQTDIKMASIWKGLLRFYMNCTACRSVFSMQL